MNNLLLILFLTIFILYYKYNKIQCYRILSNLSTTLMDNNQ